MQASLFSRSTVIVIIAYVTHVTRFADNERNIPLDFRLAQREIERETDSGKRNDGMSESERKSKSMREWEQDGERDISKESSWGTEEANIGYRRERILSIMRG